MSLFNELKKRNVFRVAIAYLALSWLLIQIVETLFPVFGLSNGLIRMTVIVLAIGFPLILLFSWLYELTPDGIKKEKDVDHSSSHLHHTGKKLDRAIIIVLALSLGYFAFDKFVLDPARDVHREELATQKGRTEALVESYGDKSIAVLAFEDMSQDKDQEYLSDGIAEELLNLLAKIPELRVISRSSAFSYKDKDIKLAQVAEELNVAHILEGSVRKAGNRVRITAQLIEARTDTHLWSQTYDRALDDIFAIQDEIAATVVKQFKITLLDAVPKVKKTDPEAYALHLQGRHQARRGTAEGIALSIDLNHQALVLDPDYADAWMGLANNYDNQVGLGVLSIKEGAALSLAATEKALLIQPDDAYTVAGLAWIEMAYNNDLVAAARHFTRAMELGPANPSVIAQAAMMMSRLGRHEQAIALFKESISLDPVGQHYYGNLSQVYISVGRWDEAIAACQTTLQLSPDFAGMHITIGIALLLKGEAEAALEEIQQESFEVSRLIGVVMARYALNDKEASDAALNELIEKHEQDAVVDIAYVLAYRDEADRAFEWLDKAVEIGRLTDIAWNPLFSSIHDDPRWLPFLESIGRSSAQLDAIEFEVMLPR